jgi:hypothetical protein
MKRWIKALALFACVWLVAPAAQADSAYVCKDLFDDGLFDQAWTLMITETAIKTAGEAITPEFEITKIEGAAIYGKGDDDRIEFDTSTGKANIFLIDADDVPAIELECTKK